MRKTPADFFCCPPSIILSFGIHSATGTMLITPSRYTKKLIRQLIIASAPAIKVATTPPSMFMAEE